MINNNQEVDLTYKLTFTELNTNFASNTAKILIGDNGCVYDVAYYSSTCSGTENHTWDEVYGQGVYCPYKDTITREGVMSLLSCPATGGGGNPDSTNNNPSSNSASSSNGNSTVVIACNPKNGPCIEVPDCGAANQVAELTSALVLTPEVTGCLLQPNNCTNAQALFTFHNANLTETAFSKAAAEAICSNGEVDYEDNIIYDASFENYPCHKLVIESAVGTCSPLTQLVLDIFEANDNSNLIFEALNIISNTNNANANTSSTSSYDAVNHTCNTTIKFKISYLENATDLSIARTAIHESLHAIFVYMIEEDLLLDSNGNADVGFEQLVQAYIDYKSGLPEYLGIAHHQLMSDFVDDMALSLSNYSSANGYNSQNGNDITLEFCKKLCWSGLTTTQEFLTLYPKYIDPSDATNNPTNYNPEWLDIKLTIQAEIYNQQQTFLHPNGNVYDFIPKGTLPNTSVPCL